MFFYTYYLILYIYITAENLINRSYNLKSIQVKATLLKLLHGPKSCNLQKLKELKQLINFNKLYIKIYIENLINQNKLTNHNTDYLMFILKFVYLDI